MLIDSTDNSSPEIRGDFLNQLLFVGDAARRLISMQDRDPQSPSFGSFHCAYWRDKTSEFADARFQEAGAALGLLAHPCLAALGAARGWPGCEELNGACHAGLLNLQRLQYPEGCYDEWYKGERGFAATAFTTFAYAAACNSLGPLFPERTRDVLLATLRPAAGWLVRHDDFVKINHEIAAAAALAAFAKVSGEVKWRDAASLKMQRSLARQTGEGWFPELRGMDFGYCALALDYMMLYSHMGGDGDVVQPAAKLMEFLLPHLHPDVTLSGEGGTCRNSYAGQCGFLLLAPSNSAANAITGQLAGLKSSVERIYSYLGDDLRLARWSLLPVLGALLSANENKVSFKQSDIPYPQGWTVHKASAVTAYHRDALHVYVPFAGGSVTRIYVGSELCISDLGPSVATDRTAYTALTYSAQRPITLFESGISIAFDLTKPKYFFPRFSQRLLLRLGSVTALTSKFTRAAIDFYRQRKKTAVNQSSASVGGGKSGVFLTRSIAIESDEVVITDRLDGVAAMQVEPRLWVASRQAGQARPSPAKGRLTIRKSFRISNRELDETVS